MPARRLNHGLERVKRTGAEIAVDDPQRARRRPAWQASGTQARVWVWRGWHGCHLPRVCRHRYRREPPSAVSFRMKGPAGLGAVKLSPKIAGLCGACAALAIAAPGAAQAVTDPTKPTPPPAQPAAANLAPAPPSPFTFTAAYAADLLAGCCQTKLWEPSFARLPPRLSSSSHRSSVKTQGEARLLATLNIPLRTNRG
jgi:hypothetical protein